MRLKLMLSTCSCSIEEHGASEQMALFESERISHALNRPKREGSREVISCSRRMSVLTASSSDSPARSSRSASVSETSAAGAAEFAARCAPESMFTDGRASRATLAPRVRHATCQRRRDAELPPSGGRRLARKTSPAMEQGQTFLAARSTAGPDPSTPTSSTSGSAQRSEPVERLLSQPRMAAARSRSLLSSIMCRQITPHRGEPGSSGAPQDP